MLSQSTPLKRAIKDEWNNDDDDEDLGRGLLILEKPKIDFHHGKNFWEKDQPLLQKRKALFPLAYWSSPGGLILASSLVLPESKIGLPAGIRKNSL